jgi:C_GCAxxG_C_C family probable redox protein
MLLELLKSGYAKELDLNCAEKILYGSNEAYHLGLDKDSLKLAAGFGGGMAIEDKCGALTAAIMVLGRLAVKDYAHESTKIKDLTIQLFDEYKRQMGNIDCAPLKVKYKTDEIKCRDVIYKAAEILDKIIVENKLI